MEEEEEFDIKIDRGPKIGTIKPRAIRIYEGREIFKEIDSSIERGEEPFIEVYENINIQRGPEIALVFRGPYHIEEYPRDPRRREHTKHDKTWGRIVFGREEFVKLLKELLRKLE